MYEYDCHYRTRTKSKEYVMQILNVFVPLRLINNNERSKNTRGTKHPPHTIFKTIIGIDSKV